jgi:hypothetical protein
MCNGKESSTHSRTWSTVRIKVLVPAAAAMRLALSLTFCGRLLRTMPSATPLMWSAHCRVRVASVSLVYVGQPNTALAATVGLRRQCSKRTKKVLTGPSGDHDHAQCPMGGGSWGTSAHSRTGRPRLRRPTEPTAPSGTPCWPLPSKRVPGTVVWPLRCHRHRCRCCPLCAAGPALSERHCVSYVNRQVS